MPHVSVLAQPLGHFVRLTGIGITMDFKLRMVMLPQKRQEIEPDDMVAQVGGNVADPQSPVWRTTVAMVHSSGDGRLQGQAPSRMLRVDLLGTIGRIKLQRIKIIAGWHYFLRVQARALPIKGNGFLDAPAVF